MLDIKYLIDINHKRGKLSSLRLTL